MMKHIAFDLGAESGRAIVGQIIDGKLNMEEIHRFPTKGTFVNGSLRWDIYRLFSELKNGLKEYSKRYADEPCTMGVDTWGIDFGFLDRNGKLCSNLYHYRDKRTVGTAKVIDKKLGLDTLYDLTGVQQMEINSLNQLIAAKKLDDSVFDVGEKMLFLGDILHYFLCGSTKAEYTISTTSNMYSTIDSCWSDTVLDTFDIDKKLMPEVVKAGDVLGTVRKDLAHETGISIKCKIITPAVHDTASAACSAPGFGENVAYISSGTWSLCGLELDEACVNEKTRKNNIANYGGAFDKILFLKNVMGLWLIQQSRDIWIKSNPNLSYSNIVDLAIEAKPFYGFIDPDDKRFLNPKDMTKAVCTYLADTNQKTVEADDIGQIARIIFESLAMKYRHVFDLLRDATGKTIDELNIIGGGIQNRLLTQFAANAMGIKVVAGPIEATAMGNILTQAYGSGEINSISELRQIIKDTDEPIEYLPKDRQEWEAKFETFKKACQLLEN
jgi:rhamnulokinase